MGKEELRYMMWRCKFPVIIVINMYGKYTQGEVKKQKGKKRENEYILVLVNKEKVNCIKVEIIWLVYYEKTQKD